jgi:hypothetical protein
MDRTRLRQNGSSRRYPLTKVLKSLPDRERRLSIGLPALRNRCVHFNNWLATLEALNQ